MKTEIGLIGLSTMGANLARNIARNGYKISVFNRSPEKTKHLIEIDNNKNLTPFLEIKEFIESIERPRKIILLVQAGQAVDSTIENILPLLDKEDIIIDCGNSNFEDTIRREKELRSEDIYFMGCGISGGEEGALNGPSIMPGGNEKSWQSIKDIFQSIAAKDFNNKPCVTHIGNNGSGHYVKMVHNGIEYAVMQIMAEAYDLFRKVYKLSSIEIADIFAKFNQGKLKSFLFEISVPVLSKKDDDSSDFLLDKILDSAGQKGTGRWTAVEGLLRGIPISSISESVFARITSSQKEKRINLSKIYENNNRQNTEDLSLFINKIEDALFIGMLLCYAQGFDLIKQASDEYNWNVNLKEISRIWQGGCIIRAKILKTLEEAFKSDPNKSMLEIDVLQNYFKTDMKSLKEIVITGVKNNISLPVFTSSLNYFNAMTEESSPANFIQGLRDLFGAHTYQRLDKDGTFHTKWENN